MLEIDVLHARAGHKDDKKIDTSTEHGRQEAAVLLNRLLQEGTAIFLERGKKAFRVKSYDPQTDMLIVNTEKYSAVRTKAGKAKTTAVAPIAGG
jgi:hypothetical protein